MTTLTTLIPAYKATYLGETLQGLVRQSFQDFEVIVGDDSPDGSISRLLQQGELAALARRLRLSVIKGPGHSRLNHDALLRAWGGRTPLVHFLHDDDVIMPGFYRAHVDLHAVNDLMLSISQRHIIGGLKSEPVMSQVPTEIEGSADRVIALDGDALITSVLSKTCNWLGELSNMVLSRTGAERYPRAPRTNRMNYFGLLDVGLVFECARGGTVALIRDHLSFWRQHGEQTTFASATHGWKMARLCWMFYTMRAWKEGILRGEDLRNALEGAVLHGDVGLPRDPCWLRMRSALHRGDELGLHGVYEEVQAAWLEFLDQHPATRPGMEHPAPLLQPAMA